MPQRAPHRAALAAAIGATALVMSACGSSGTAAPTVTVTVTPDVAQNLSSAASSVREAVEPVEEISSVNAARAIDIALGVSPGAVVALEQGRERLRPVWEVLVRSEGGAGTEVYVHRTSGEIVNQEPEEVPFLARNGAPAFTAAQAVQAAETAIAGGSVIELTLGLEGTRTVWEADVYRAGAPNMELDIAADTGDILKQEQD